MGVAIKGCRSNIWWKANIYLFRGIKDLKKIVGSETGDDGRLPNGPLCLDAHFSNLLTKHA